MPGLNYFSDEKVEASAFLIQQQSFAHESKYVEKMFCGVSHTVSGSMLIFSDKNKVGQIPFS